MLMKRLLILFSLVFLLGMIPVWAGSKGGRGAKPSASRGGTRTSVSRGASQRGRATQARHTTTKTRALHNGNRGRGSGHRRGHYGANRYSGYRNYGYPSYFSWGSPYFGLYSGLYYGLGYYSWAWGSPYYHGSYAGYRNARTYQSGSIKLKVQPKDAQVFLNGQNIGKAGKFDGWPSSLWLEKGRYELILYKDGMETVRKEIEVFPRVNQKLRLEMTPGAAKPIEEVSKAVANRQKNRKELYQRYSKDRDKRKDPVRRPNPKQKVRPGAPTVEYGDSLDLRTEPAHLSLIVAPGDAAIFLDGHFVSSARALTDREGLITLDAGSHEIEIMRPGHKGEKKTFMVDAGQTLELKFDLKDHN